MKKRIVKKQAGGTVSTMGPESLRRVAPGGGSGNPNAVGRQPPVNPGRMQPRPRVTQQGPGGGLMAGGPGGNRPMPAPPGGGLRAALGSIPTNSNRTQSNPGGGNPDAVGRQMPAPPGGGLMAGRSLQTSMPPTMAKGGPVKKMAAGGSASKRADGVATHGKTKGKFI